MNRTIVLSFALLLSAAASGAGEGIALWHEGRKGEAVARWLSSAGRGNTEAMVFLGYAYRQGWADGRDEREALRWYRQAAERGSPEAQYELALMLELGIGTEPDPNEAAFWYQRSSAQMCPDETSAGGPLDGH